jgi:hypothetical protein
MNKVIIIGGGIGVAGLTVGTIALVKYFKDRKAAKTAGVSVKEYRAERKALREAEKTKVASGKVPVILAEVV